MSDNKNNSSKNTSLPVKIFIICVVALIIIIALTIVFGGFLLGIKGFFAITGVTYDSTKTFFLFIVFFFIASLLVDLLLLVCRVFLSLFPFPLLQKKWLLFLTELYFTWLVIHLVDYWMSGITIETWTEFLGAILLACIEMLFDEKKERKKDA